MTAPNTVPVYEWLAAKCEAAEAGEQAALFTKVLEAWNLESPPSYGTQVLFLRYRDARAFLDAAALLVPEGMIWMLTNAGIEHPTQPDFTKSSAVVDDWQSTGPMRECVAATPGLALCAAALRARSAHEPSSMDAERLDDGGRK